MIDKKISLVMPCTLMDYEGSASNKPLKLNRAIQSFLRQSYNQSELVIVADGDHSVIDFVKSNYGNESRIKTFFIEKQPFFSGNVRDLGLKAAEGYYVAYLDADDLIKETHLQAIIDGFNNNPECDWLFFDDYIKYFSLDHLPVERRNSELTFGSVGTSNIAHKNLPEITWNGCNEYGHDFTFVSRLMANYKNYKKIDGCGYVVCHIPKSVDS